MAIRGKEEDKKNGMKITKDFIFRLKNKYNSNALKQWVSYV